MFVHSKVWNSVILNSEESEPDNLLDSAMPGTKNARAVHRSSSAGAGLCTSPEARRQTDFSPVLDIFTMLILDAFLSGVERFEHTLRIFSSNVKMQCITLAKCFALFFPAPVGGPATAEMSDPRSAVPAPSLRSPRGLGLRPAHSRVPAR